MLKFPVQIDQHSDGTFRASWVDFSVLEPASGATAQAAFEALIDQSFEHVADAVARGEYPEPSPAQGRPVVSFSAPGQVQAHHLSRLIAITRYGTFMSTYSWTNGYAFVE